MQGNIWQSKEMVEYFFFFLVILHSFTYTLKKHDSAKKEAYIPTSLLEIN